MSRRQKDPLRPLTQGERAQLEQLSRSRSQAASHLTRAKALLAVADGNSYTEAARQSGYALGDSVAQLVARFNREGVDALLPGHGGGPQILYSAARRELIAHCRPAATRHGCLALEHAAGVAHKRGAADGPYLCDPVRAARGRAPLAGGPHLV